MDAIEDASNFQLNVVVRARPLTYKEQANNVLDIISVDNSSTIYLHELDSKQKVSKEVSFSFDKIFDKTADQRTIYKHTAQPLLDFILNGYNVSVFAYGATGAGKTFTMIGTNEKPGVIFMTLREFFHKIEERMQFRDYVVKLSFIEVYNEIIRDLLTEDNKGLELWEDPLRGIIVAGVSEIMVSSPDEITEILRIGTANRTKEATQANEASSRSHAVLQVQVEHKDKNQGIDEEINYAKLSMIDLAGSERMNATNNKGIRLLESAKINQSLLCLASCIQALSKNSEKGQKNHIPYRNSKLTRLLKDSLGGNCKTVMIANISPGHNAHDETYNTLNYASQAKKIKLSYSKNVVRVSNHIANFAMIIQNLKKENDVLRKQLIKGNHMNNEIVQGGGSASFEDIKYEILSHFQNEMELVKKLLELEQKLGKDEFSQYKTIYQNTKEKFADSLQKFENQTQINKNKGFLDQMKNSKADLMKNLQKLQAHRDTFLQRIKLLPSKEQDFLHALFKEKSLQIEVNINFGKQKKNDDSLKVKDKEIVYLLKQLELKDQIINNQKKVITGSLNISASQYDDSDYEGLKNRAEIFKEIYKNVKSTTNIPYEKKDKPHFEDKSPIPKTKTISPKIPIKPGGKIQNVNGSFEVMGAKSIENRYIKSSTHRNHQAPTGIKKISSVLAQEQYRNFIYKK